MKHLWVATCGVVLVMACDDPGTTDGVPQDAADTTTSDADATTADTSTPDTTDTSGDTVTPTGPLVDPQCLDGQYEEAIPTELPSIDDLVSAYNEADYLAFTDAVLARRYPTGAWLVSEGVREGSARFGNCVTRFTSNRGQAQSLLRQLSTVVHECGHVLDLSLSGFSDTVLVIDDTLRFECLRGDTTTRGGDTFARSLLNTDPYSALLPDDFYKDVYLDCDPDDQSFDSGDQGFNSVLEEAIQYVNSLATDYHLRDRLGGFSITAKDGILTFLWYIQRYLRMARLEYPAAYSRLTNDTCWREAILTTWGRAWLYLEAARDNRNLGIDADTIEDLVRDPALLDEIARLRGAHGCP
jgi:hypothetical protein